jgi:hypothetical protein
MGQQRLTHCKSLSGETFCPGSALASSRYDFIESCYWTVPKVPRGELAAWGADGRPELQKFANIGFVDANGVCLSSSHFMEGTSCDVVNFCI